MYFWITSEGTRGYKHTLTVWWRRVATCVRTNRKERSTNMHAAFFLHKWNHILKLNKAEQFPPLNIKVSTKVLVQKRPFLSQIILSLNSVKLGIKIFGPKNVKTVSYSGINTFFNSSGSLTRCYSDAYLHRHGLLHTCISLSAHIKMPRLTKRQTQQWLHLQLWSKVDVPASTAAGGIRVSSLWWTNCVQKSDAFCLNQTSGVFVCFQCLYPNTEQTSLLISAEMPLGSVFPLIKIGAGRRSWQDNSGIQVSKHNLRPELCSWHHRSAELLLMKSAHRDGQSCRWSNIFDGRKVTIAPRWSAMLSYFCSGNTSPARWRWKKDFEI